MMRIVVCIKQVPDVTEVSIDPKTGTLVREGVQSILNPFCEYALDQAVRLKQANTDVEISAISMGPQQAQEALLRCYELGADRAILLTDPGFAGADTWATAQTLAQAIKQLVPDFDLILTGRQAIDGDTAQVGPELAEILGLPQVSGVTQISLPAENRYVRAVCENEQGYEIVQTPLPAILSVSKGEQFRRMPSLQMEISAHSYHIDCISAEQLHLGAETIGLQGSYTQVVKIFPPPARGSSHILTGMDAEEAAQQIFAYLKDHHFLDHLHSSGAGG